MPKNILILIGILVALLPLISIPSSWKTPIFFTLGFLIVLSGYLSSKIKKRPSPSRNLKERKLYREGSVISPIQQTSNEEHNEEVETNTHV